VSWATSSNMPEGGAPLRGGCTRAVLFTVIFQAPGFYERAGYEVLGRIECDPLGHTRICMTKKLGGTRSPPILSLALTDS
jgi:hypothetical protein